MIEPLIETTGPNGETVYKLHPLIRQIHDRLEATLGRKPTLEEVAAEFKRLNREIWQRTRS